MIPVVGILLVSCDYAALCPDTGYDSATYLTAGRGTTHDLLAVLAYCELVCYLCDGGILHAVDGGTEGNYTATRGTLTRLAILGRLKVAATEPGLVLQVPTHVNHDLQSRDLLGT